MENESNDRRLNPEYQEMQYSWENNVYVPARQEKKRHSGLSGHQERVAFQLGIEVVKPKRVVRSKRKGAWHVGDDELNKARTDRGDDPV